MKQISIILVVYLIGLYSCKSDLRLDESGRLSSETELIKSIKTDIDMDHINWVVTEGSIINLRTGINMSWVNDSTIQINTKDGNTVYFIQNTRAMYDIIRSLSDKKLREKITILNNTIKQ